MKKRAVLLCMAILLGYGTVPLLAQAEAAGIEQLGFLIGDWRVETRQINPRNGQWQAPGWSTASFNWILDGAMIRELATNTFDGQQWKFNSTYSYDKYRQQFRAAINDNVNGYMDFYSGEFNGEELIITNLEHGTGYPDPQSGQTLYFKMRFKPEGSDRFSLQVNISLDGGSSWLPYITATYHRAE